MINKNDSPKETLPAAPAVNGPEVSDVLPEAATDDLQTKAADDLPALAADDLPAEAADDLPALAADDLPALAADDLPALAADDLPTKTADELPPAQPLPASYRLPPRKWFFTFMCMNIPIIGWIYLLTKAYGKKENQLKDFARAYLLYKLIFLIVSLLILGFLVYVGIEVADRVLAYMEML